MADPRTFVLIGDFQDNITPALESINNSIAGLKRTMSAMSTRRGGGFSDVTQSVGKLVSAQIHLKEAIEGVGKAAREATGELKEYKNVVGKVASAHYHIARAGQQAGDKIASSYDKAISSARELRREEKSMASTRRLRDRSLATAASTPRTSTRSTRSSGGGGGGGYRGGGGGGMGGGSFDMTRFTLAFGAADAIATPITSAIVAGFQIGVGMMMKPFEYFVNGMKERMQDEMSDLKAASGFFSINRMSERKFLEKGSFQEAIDFMQKNNALMAKLAGSLPGSTQDFIEVNKRISDSIAQLVTNAPERAMALAEKIRKEETSTAYANIAPITGPATAKGMQNAMQVLMADLTKQTVLAGQGTGSGMQGAMGAYGLPQLTERMLSQQNISMGQMQRYAAIFKDPMIMRNLEKELPKISATMANTPERYAALREFYEKVLPPELVERYRRTLMGVQETFNTAIFSPETGIFGLGRKMKDLGGAFDEFGRMLDENGKVTKDITEQARIDIDLYGLFRDVLVNIGRVLAPIAENLSSFWDPLLNIGKLLERARVVTFEVLRSFEIYNKSFGNFAKTLNEKDLQRFSQTGGKELRASLATLANLFRSLGVLSGAEFEGVMDQLVKVDLKGGDIFKGLLDKFFNSEVARQIGEFIGSLVGTVISEVSQVTGFLSGRISSSGKLFEGLRKGFVDAGGPQAFTNIFKDVFTSMFKVLINIARVMPLEGWILGGLMLTLPLAIQTFAVALGQKIANIFLDRGANSCLSKITGGMCGIGGGPGGGGPGGKPRRGTPGGVAASSRPTGLVSGPRSVAMRPVGPRAPKGFENIALPGSAPSLYGVTQPGMAPGIPKPIKPLKKPSFGMFSKIKAKGAGTLASAVVSMEAAAPGLAKGMSQFAKSIPKGMGIMAGLDFGMRLLSGESLGRAAGGAASSFGGAVAGGKAGAALGTMITPGAGTLIGGVIGSVAGGIMGDKLFDFLVPETQKQVLAAQTQMVAASRQMEAANKQGTERTGIDIGAAQSFVENPMKFYQAATLMGEQNNPTVKALQDAVTSLKVVAPKVTEQEKKYNDLISKFIKPADQGGLGYSREQANLQPEVIAAKKELARLKESETSLRKNVSELFNKLPPKLTESLVKTVGKVNDAALTAAFVAKINNIKVPQVKYNWTNINPNQPPNPGDPLDLFKFPPKPPENKQEGLNLSRFTRSSRKNWGEGCSIGGLGGGSVSSVDSFNSIARSSGLSLTSGYRPGSKGWHGVDRARDYSNGYSPTPQMMEFAQTLASQYGGKLKELIYTPLGYSIKDGRKVPPIAAGGHYNHVHVAYATGFPSFGFANEKEALAWEKKATLGSTKVASITAREGEFGGGTQIGNINVTVNAGNISDPDLLADVVAQRILSEMQTDSIFV